jgi:hypothetical protein
MPASRAKRTTSAIGAVDPALQRPPALRRQVDDDGAIGAHGAIHDFVGTRKRVEIDGTRELAVRAQERPVRRVGIDRGEGRRAIHAPLSDQARDDALAYAALLTADEVDVTHAP